MAFDSAPRTQRRHPLLCYVTDRRSLQTSSKTDSIEQLLKRIDAVAAAGVDWIQLREKDLSGRDSGFLTHEALRCVLQPSVRQRMPTRVLVNDRLDVALAEGAGGAHLGEGSVPVAQAKRLLGLANDANKDSHRFLVGVSCHSSEAAKLAAMDGADYIFFGPIYATPSKASFGPPQGVERLAEVCNAIGVPVIAIGGITLENFSGCLSAGAAGLAAIRLFQDSVDPSEIVRTIGEHIL